MRGKGTVVTVLAIAGAGAAAIAVPSTAAGGGGATAAQDSATLSLSGKAYTRSLRLRRTAPLAGWAVKNVSQVDATGVETCVEFPAGFKIGYLPVNRPPGVKITSNKRKACIPIPGGTIYVASSSEFNVEGTAPRTVGNYKVKLTATSDNAPTATKTLTLKILRRCTAQRCPGFAR